MAKNLYEVVLNLFIPFLLLSIVSSINNHFENKNVKKWHWNALIILFFLVLVVSVLRQWRLIKYNQINNIYLLNISLISGFLYCSGIWIYFSTVKKSKDLTPKVKIIFEICLTVLGLLFCFCQFFYKIPLVIFLPLQFLGLGENIFSTMYLMKITGFAFAWLLCILFCIETYRLLVRTGTKGKSICFSIFYILSGFINFTAIIGIINSYYRRKIKIPSNLRKSIPKLIAAEDIVFFAVIFIFLAIALFFFLRHLKVKGEWENPAQHRILRRYERDCRRIGAFAFILGLLVLLDCTVIKKKANRLVELSPSEEFQIDGNRIYIPLEQVSDGHLHRFSWTNEKGKTIRFIIVQKRGTNFGVGFDACEVCGNVGYYERKNEIVCNRCDVVMNKNTIGLKGGCNPIPLESKIEDGGIVIYTQNLNLEAGRF